MARNTRREFLKDVGNGMLIAGLGASLAHDLGIGQVFADDSLKALDFGKLESLVALMQDTEPNKLMAVLVEKLKSGTGLQTLTAAGALANARTFGGHDYIGFHTFMALAPAYRMSLELPTEFKPLPVLKVLYRNTKRIQEFGGRQNEVLHKIAPIPIPAGANGGEYLREIARRGDLESADGVFASMTQGPIGEAFNHLQYEIEDEVDVHRVVLAWRAFDTLDLVGSQWAHCLLRQSVHYCVTNERQMTERQYPKSTIRTVLPVLLDQYKLLAGSMGKKSGEDTWLKQLAETIFRGTRDQAADATAQAIQEGYSAESIGEAISLAANMLVLHDPGRVEQQANSDKPVGSCHGDSVGVHASDSANAWRNIVRVSNHRNAVASLIVGAFHTGGQSSRSNAQPYPFPEQLASFQSQDAQTLLNDVQDAIESKDQLRTAAIVAKYGQLGHQSRPLFDLLLTHATSHDGALHAEKYYHTVSAEFASTRPAFQWGHLVALARVSASEFGHQSAGYLEAKKLLNV